MSISFDPPQLPQGLEESLRSVVGEEWFSQDPMYRLAYARDQWPRCLLRLRKGQVDYLPDAVVHPGTAQQTAECLRILSQASAPVTALTAGSAVTGAATPTQGGVVLDLKRLDELRSVRPQAGLAEAETGILGIHLEEALQRHGMTLGHYPSSVICSALGGWIAGRSAGQCSSRYGKIEDMIFDLELALPDGTVERTGGSSFDLAPLIVGSEGTGPLVTAAKLRIFPKPASRAFAGVLMPGVEPGLEAFREILQEEGLRVSVMRLYDEFDTIIAGKGSDDGGDGVEVEELGPLVGRSEGPVARFFKAPFRAVASAATSGGLRMPRFLNRLADSVLPSRCMLILVSETEREGDAEKELEVALEVCKRRGGKVLGPGPGRHWYENRYKISFKQPRIYELGAFVDTMEVAARWSRLPGLYRKVKEALSRHAFVMAHFSHAYVDGCSIYFTFAAPLSDRAEEIYDAAWRDGLRAAHEAGGSISHHHGIGVNKAPEMVLEFGEPGLDVLRALRKVFDPAGVMNPGKL